MPIYPAGSVLGVSKFAMSARLACMITDFGFATGISPWVCVVERRSASEENELTLRVDAKK